MIRDHRRRRRSVNERPFGGLQGCRLGRRLEFNMAFRGTRMLPSIGDWVEVLGVQWCDKSNLWFRNGSRGSRRLRYLEFGHGLVGGLLFFLTPSHRNCTLQMAGGCNCAIVSLNSNDKSMVCRYGAPSGRHEPQLQLIVIFIELFMAVSFARFRC